MTVAAVDHHVSCVCSDCRNRRIADAAEMHEAKTQHRQHVEAKRIGSLALVEAGYAVYSRDRRDRDDYPIGGIVVEVDWSAPDPETGERARVFTCLSSRPEFGRPFRVRLVREDELGEPDIQMPNTSDLKGITARLDEAAMKAWRKGGPVLPEVVVWQQWALLLASLVVHGARR